MMRRGQVQLYSWHIEDGLRAFPAARLLFIDVTLCCLRATCTHQETTRRTLYRSKTFTVSHRNLVISMVYDNDILSYKLYQFLVFYCFVAYWTQLCDGFG